MENYSQDIVQRKLGALTGVQTLQWLDQYGARFCKVSSWKDHGVSPGKRPLENGWPDKPLHASEIIAHLEMGANVGLVCGKHSGGLCLLDVDEDYSGFIQYFPAISQSPTIVREGADKGKIIIQITDGSPPSKKWKHSPADKSPFFELLSSGNQGVVSGTHPEGVPYVLIHSDYPPYTLTLESLSDICAIWAGSGLEPEEPLLPPIAVPNMTEQSSPHPSLRDRVARYWDPLRIFRYFGKVSKTREESRGQWLRLLGNGGLFVHMTNGQPDGGWSMPGQPGTGGGPFEAWMYAKYGHCQVPKGRGFYDLLLEMADAGGVPHTEQRLPLAANPSEMPPLAPSTRQIRKPDDGELAARFRNANPNLAYSFGEWKGYSEGIWTTIKDEVIELKVLKAIEEARQEGVRPSRNLLSSVTELIRLLVYIPESKWDANPDLLVLKNGTLHIPSRQLLSHDPENYVTYGLNYNYESHAEAPYWEYLLGSTIPDAADFLQEFSGYALTTDTSYEVAVWLVGPAGSGKSTFLEGLQTMLGDRATLLGLADIEQSRFSLGNLKGKTLAVASEQPAIHMQASHILNAIISGEKIHTERKFKDPIEFAPTVKLIWAMNEAPRVPEAGNGLFRRVKVVRYRILNEVTRDPQLKELIRGEGPGILNWALDGLNRLRERRKFEFPDCVLTATSDFQQNNDVAALFVRECCLVGPELKTQAQQLYDAYKNWCYQNGHKPMSSTSLAGEWDRLRFTKYSANGRNYWRGVGLAAPPL